MIKHGIVPQQTLKKTAIGFTIVELLVVIVVIAILAAITVGLYDSVATQARDASLKSDLKSTESQLALDYSKTGRYPATQADAVASKRIVASGDNITTYTRKPYGYCISANNAEATEPFMLKTLKTGTILSPGDCTTGSLTSVAGTGAAGSTDGPSDSATFRNPIDVVVSKAGDVYVADQLSQKIRKISPDGTVSTFAGSSQGYLDGVGTGARLNYPTGLAIDRNGVLYVADAFNSRIRKITPDGTVTTLAGGGSGSGIVNGVGSAARFNRPAGLTVDNSGTVYVGDSENHAIRKITPDGTVTTLAGSGSPGFVDGVGSAARFTNPRGIAVGKSGELYVVDKGNNVIRKVLQDGTVTTFAGSGQAGMADGIGTAAQFNQPQYITTDRWGMLFVSDTNNGAIRQVNPDTAEVTRVAGNGVDVSIDGGDPEWSYIQAIGIAIDANGSFYVTYSNQVKKIDI